jgi:hypothetical protein
MRGARSKQPICERRKYVVRRIMRDRSWRVLRDHYYGWEEPQRLGLDHHQPIRPEGKVAGKESRPALSLTGEAAPREACRRHATIMLQCEGPRRTRSGVSRRGLGAREAEVDSRGPLERVEAGHSEAWVSELADLVRHWFGETEDAPEELLRNVLKPGEEAGRPRLHGVSGEAPAELVFQRCEHEGSSELGGDDSSRT